MTEREVIKIEHVSFGYSRNAVLEDANLTVHERDFIWVVGPNGGGKTTLLKLMLGLLQPASGKVTVFGRNPQDVRSRIGYMPQYVDIDPHFPVSVMDIVLMGRLGNGHGFGRYSHDDRLAAERALAGVGLEDLGDRHFSTLSGGQQRRLLIARALASEPEILMLDEPMANLDLVVAEDIQALLHRLNEKLTVVMVSHDPALVSKNVKNVVCVNRTVAIHPTCEVDSRMLGDLYRGQVRMVRHDQHAEGDQTE